MSVVETLISRGVAVVPFLAAGEEFSRFALAAALFSPPELSTDEFPFALGGFQAINLASGWHAPFVRELRALADARIRPLLDALRAVHGVVHLQQLADRLLIRAPGARVTAESWHRDAPAGGGVHLGGWVNLDAEGDQQFICAPGTHVGVEIPAAGGFRPITNRAHLDEYTRREETIRVPPGHVILFYSHLVHRVANTPARAKAMRRLFIGWRLTNDARPLVPDLERLLDEQALIPLPSGQVPPLYPSNYLSYIDQNEARLVGYAARLHPYLTQRRTVGKPDARRVVRIPVRTAFPLRRLPREAHGEDTTEHYPPLLSAELSLAYPAYTEDERRVLTRNQ